MFENVIKVWNLGESRCKVGKESGGTLAFDRINLKENDRVWNVICNI